MADRVRGLLVSFGALLALVLGGLIVAPTSVSAANDATLTGTVIGSVGEPLPSTFVMVLDGPFSVGQAVTDASGHYTVANLPSDHPLQVNFGPDFNGPYLSKSVAGVTIPAGGTTVLDVQLNKSSSVAGHVTTADGTPVNGSILLYEPTTGAATGGTVVGGNFFVTGVPVGTWVGWAVSGSSPGDPWAPEYFGGASSLADATPIVVADGAQVTGVDITLDLGATVSGQVLDDQGNPASEVGVGILDLGGPPGAFAWQGTASVAGNTFTFVGLPPGTFSVDASANPLTGLSRGSTSVTVAQGGAVSGVTVSLPHGEFGTVQVVDANGPVTPGPAGASPVVCDAATPTVDVFEFCGRRGLEYMVPNPNGSGWIVGPISPGDYTAQAHTGNSLGASTPLHVSAGASFSCTLPVPGAGAAECVDTPPSVQTGSVSGRVVSNGVGVAGAEVHAWVAGPRTAQLPTRAFTDADGNYTLSGVFTGNVQIQFLAPADRPTLVPAWWSSTGSVANQSAAGVVTVVAGATSSGIDGVLTQLTHGTFTVTRAGVPLTTGFGYSAVLCPTPSVLVLSTVQCSSGAQPIQPGRGFLPIPAALLQPGDYQVQLFTTLNPRSVGAPTRLVLVGGDEFACSLPVEAAAAPSCLVNGKAPDVTPPGISGGLTPAQPDGDNLWWRGDVSMHWTVSEPDSPTSLVTTGCVDQTITSDTTGIGATCSATSDGGSAGPVELFVRRDATPPTLVWFNAPADGAVYPTGQVPSALFCFGQDSTSGPNGCEITGFSDQPGIHTLTATARDMAGNTTVETRTYTVKDPYTLVGFQSPVKMGTVNNVSNGAEVELTFEVFNGATEVTDPSIVRSLTATPVSCTTGDAVGAPSDVLGGRVLRYDTRKGVFKAEWTVPKRARGCFDVTAAVDGSAITARFRVR